MLGGRRQGKQEALAVGRHGVTASHHDARDERRARRHRQAEKRVWGAQPGPRLRAVERHGNEPVVVPQVIEFAAVRPPARIHAATARHQHGPAIRKSLHVDLDPS